MKAQIGGKVITKEGIHGIVEDIETHPVCRGREIVMVEHAVISGMLVTGTEVKGIGKLELEERIVEECIVPVNELEIVEGA